MNLQPKLSTEILATAASYLAMPQLPLLGLLLGTGPSSAEGMQHCRLAGNSQEDPTSFPQCKFWDPEGPNIRFRFVASDEDIHSKSCSGPNPKGPATNFRGCAAQKPYVAWLFGPSPLLNSRQKPQGKVRRSEAYAQDIEPASDAYKLSSAPAHEQ